MPEKSEARNPKSETNSKSEKAPKLKTARGGLVLRFGFRFLSKVTIPLRNDSENPEIIFARALIGREFGCDSARAIRYNAAMSFADFPEQKQVVQLLQRSLERGRLGHAYLFTGS